MLGVMPSTTIAVTDVASEPVVPLSFIADPPVAGSVC